MKIKASIRNKILVIILVAVVPLFLIGIYLLSAIVRYGNVYRGIVDNMTVANSYNLTFRDTIDESTYKLVVGYTTFDRIDNTADLENPYSLIDRMRRDFANLNRDYMDESSSLWIERIDNNVDTLENRVRDIEQNLELGGHYDENLEILDTGVYILTELIEDDIQQYIYCQTEDLGKIQKVLNRQARYFIISSSVTMVFCLLLIALIASEVSKSITVPVRELVDVTEKIAEGKLDARANIYSGDEIGRLSNSVNSMAEDIDGMLVRIKEDEHKMRNAEIRLLQEQINPHFLYNALDTIVWLIEVRENEKAVNMTMSLSQFFRQILSHGREYIKISEEEAHVKSYLEIQQIRYADILDYEINFDREILDYRLLKLTLQPVVENALYHGIKYKRAKGTIKIGGKLKGDLIYLTVEDDGVGIAPEELENLRENIKKPCKDTDKGFGLANVNERIRMNFGEQYGMIIESEQGVGTKVSVVVPAIPYEDDRNPDNEN